MLENDKTYRFPVRSDGKKTFQKIVDAGVCCRPWYSESGCHWPWAGPPAPLRNGHPDCATGTSGAALPSTRALR